LRLCGALEAPELAAAADFATNGLRASHRDDVTRSLSAVTSRYPTAEIVTRLQASGVPCSPVNTIQDIIKDEQALSTGMFLPLPRPDIPGLTVMNTPMTFDGAYRVAGAPPPMLGQGGTEALAAIGMSRDEIEGLVRAGIVGVASDMPGAVGRALGT
jgi:CoA:oxalate CoA-transferase